MSHILEFPSFTLKKGVSEAEFLLVHEKFNQDFMIKQKGYISHKLLRDGDTWFDLVVWESAEAMEKAFQDIYKNDAAAAYISLIDQIGSDEKIPLFSVVKDY
jgi:heme-degrading monooxygenase HmoA